MANHIELLKKLKALSDKGVGGEAENAQQMLTKMLEKHNLTIEDIEGVQTHDYYFNAKGIEGELLLQIVKRVNYDLKVYGFPQKVIKDFGLKGNTLVTCTHAEFIEIEQMFDVYKKLFKKESEIFYTAFLSANDLLISPPKEKQRTVDDLSEKELEKWNRVQQISKNIKSETIRRQISEGI